MDILILCIYQGLLILYYIQRIAQMDPEKTAGFLSLKLTLYTEDLVPPGGKFKNLNIISCF